MINFRIIIFFIVDRYWSLLFYLFTNVLSYYFTVLKQWYNQISQVKVLTQRPHTEQGEVADPEVHPLDPEGEWADSEEVCYWYVIKLPCTIASFKNWFLCLLHRHVCSHLQIVIYSSSIACPRLVHPYLIVLSKATYMFAPSLGFIQLLILWLSVSNMSL